MLHVDGAMRGVGGSSRLAYSTADYGSFRLIFTARMAPVNRDHLGVLFWGDRPKDPSKPKIDNAGWIQFMPPHGAMWDYHPPKHHNLRHEPLAKGSMGGKRGRSSPPGACFSCGMGRIYQMCTASKTCER